MTGDIFLRNFRVFFLVWKPCVSFCALPWIIETGRNSGEDWSGTIYCTKPTAEFARIYLAELRKYCDLSENECKSAMLGKNKRKLIQKTFD